MIEREASKRYQIKSEDREALGFDEYNYFRGYQGFKAGAEFMAEKCEKLEAEKEACYLAIADIHQRLRPGPPKNELPVRDPQFIGIAGHKHYSRDAHQCAAGFHNWHC